MQAKTRDLTEALTYQTGSANILKVIASSPTDVEPVLKAIVESACELCDANDAASCLKDGDDLRFSAHHGPIDDQRGEMADQPTTGPPDAHFSTVSRCICATCCPTKATDFRIARHCLTPRTARTFEPFCAVPLLREDESIGAIVLRRTEVRPFSDKQIELLQTFADQAVIAIGNVRLFDEVQARTRELTESLQQQTAISDILRVISSSRRRCPARVRYGR